MVNMYERPSLGGVNENSPEFIELFKIVGEFKEIQILSGNEGNEKIKKLSEYAKIAGLIK